MSQIDVSPFPDGSDGPADRSAPRSGEQMPLGSLAAAIDRTILPRRYQLGRNGHTIDIFALDRKIVGYRGPQSGSRGPFHPITAKISRDEVMRLVRELDEFRGGLPDDQIAVHRLTEAEKAALTGAGPLGLTPVEIRKLAEQSVTADAQPPIDPSPATPDSKTETYDQAVQSIDRLKEMFRANANDFFFCAANGPVERFRDASESLSEAAITALATSLWHWETKLSGSGLSSGKLICGIRPGNDTLAMVCVLKDNNLLYAEVRSGRIGRLIGHWLQLERGA